MWERVVFKVKSRLEEKILGELISYFVVRYPFLHTKVTIAMLSTTLCCLLLLLTAG